MSSIISRKKYTFALLVLVVLALAAASVPGEAGSAPESIAVLDSLTGDSTVVEGKVVYVDFWASWCVPCRRSFPWMMELLGKYGDRGLQIVAINVDRERAAADDFLKKTNAALPVVYDPEGKLAKLYNLEVMPTSFIYGRDGKLIMSREGFVPEETESVEALIKKLLGEEPGN